MKKVTGIGGIFFKVKDVEATKKWYRDNLGINSDQYGYLFRWKDDPASASGTTTWAPFPSTTKYFEPSDSLVMINFRVANLDELVVELQENGVELVGTPEKHSYGKFAWVMDPDGIKIELWEPVDEAL